MSLFRRPKKPIRPRLIQIDHGSDDEMDDTPAPQPPSSSSGSVTKNGGKIAKEDRESKSSSSSKKDKDKESKKPSASTLLSFDDDIEGETEVFKVKKSSVSRRLMKQRDKEKKGETSKKSEKYSEDSKHKIESFVNNEIKVKVEPKDEIIIKKSKQQQENEYLRILNGREAEAIHFEDEEDEEDEDDFDNELKFRRPQNKGAAATEAVRRALESGEIPDANLIHEARKRRQLARETGYAAEFIPVDSTDRYRNEKSRLVRDDENDHSGDDEERIDFSKATNSTKIEIEKRREAFNAAEDEVRDRLSEGESDPELEEWEAQQLRKAVTQTQMHNVAKEVFQQNPYYNSSQDTNSLYPRFPQIKAESHTSANVIEDIVNGRKKILPEIILKQLNIRLSNLKISLERDEGALSRLTADLELAEQDGVESEKLKPELSTRFELYQNLGRYVQDLTDCYSYKLPVIEMLEKRMLELIKSKSDSLCERRRQDVKDQLEEVQATINILSGNNTVPPPSEIKSRRAAEREGRRTRRRRNREIKNLSNHKDGLSSDDEETEFELNNYNLQKATILTDASHVFDDVNDDFGTLTGVLSRFEEWREVDFDAYKESYAFMCLPKCLSPLIRLYLISWDPLSDGFDMSTFSWMRHILTFSSKKKETYETLSVDPDSRLLPSLAEKILLPWIEKVVKEKWDPMSTKETRKLQKVVSHFIHEWSVGPNCKLMNKLMQCIVSKFRDALNTDVYMPLFPNTALTKKGSPAALFSSRQFWSSVKLLDNMSAWIGLLSDKILQTLALDYLLTRYILIGIRNCSDLNESVERAKGVVNVLPRSWLSRDNESEVPNGLQQLVRCLISIVQCADISTINRVTIPEFCKVLNVLGAAEESQTILKKYS